MMMNDREHKANPIHRQRDALRISDPDPNLVIIMNNCRLDSKCIEDMGTRRLDCQQCSASRSGSKQRADTARTRLQSMREILWRSRLIEQDETYKLVCRPLHVVRFDELT